MFLALLFTASIAAADTVTYPVLNHGRPAGEMIVIRSGDSVVVRYRHIDRNRGQRSETRYRFTPGGELVAAELAPAREELAKAAAVQAELSAAQAKLKEAELLDAELAEVKAELADAPVV